MKSIKIHILSTKNGIKFVKVDWGKCVEVIGISKLEVFAPTSDAFTSTYGLVVVVVVVVSVNRGHGNGEKVGG